MIEEGLLQTLRQESTKPDPMTPITVRVPIEMESEIRGFCAHHSLAIAVVIRECIRRGWSNVREEIFDEIEERTTEE